MGTRKLLGAVVGITALLGSIAIPAVAITCTTEDRTFPVPGGNDAVTMSCIKKEDGLPAVSGNVGATRDGTGARRSVSAQLLTGTGSIASIALDSAGNAIAGCTASDASTAGSVVIKDCPSVPAKWRGVVTF